MIFHGNLSLFTGNRINSKGSISPFNRCLSILPLRDVVNAEGFKQGAKFGEAALSRQAEGALLKTLLC